MVEVGCDLDFLLSEPIFRHLFYISHKTKKTENTNRSFTNLGVLLSLEICKIR